MRVFNVLTPEQVESLKQKIQAFEFKDGRQTAFGSAAAAKKNLQITEENPKAQPIFQDIHRLFIHDPLLSAYTEAKAVISPRVALYPKGALYDWHVDLAVMDGLRTDLSFTLFLSAKEEYEGGELELDHGNHKQIVKADKGQMVIYPTGVLHRVKEVTQGERLCIVGWVNSHIPDHEEREALFRFQHEIRQLSTKVPNAQELNQLAYLHQYFRRKAVR